MTPSYHFASRIDEIGLSMIRQIMMKAKGCVNLGIGEPDFFAPNVIREEAHRILEEEKTGYSPTAGIAELREAVWRYHGSLSDHEVCITNGSQEALFDLLFALVEPGDEVLVPDPGFAAYPTVARLAGATPVSYPLNREDGFRLPQRLLEKNLSARSCVIVLNSPSNPTGQCLDREQMHFIAQLAEKKNLVILSDEIYRELHYLEEKPVSMAEVTDRAVIVSGISKMASMTGWRIGWACGPMEIIEKATVMHQYTATCAPTLAQKAALKIFTKEGQEAIRAQRKLLGETLQFLCPWIETELDRRFVRPQGAFYLMLSVEDLPMDSFTVCSQLLQDGVATIPGSAFGPQGEGFLRLSFACEREKLEAGLNLLKKGLTRLSNS